MRTIFSILLFLTTINSYAQKTFELKDLFAENSIVWYGIDYSRTTFIGMFADKDLHEYFKGWNRMIVEERYKYDVTRFLQKKSVINDIGSVENINQESIPVISKVDSERTLLKSDFAEMISAYHTQQTEGIGFVMIAERYNKSKEYAVHYAVIFDVATRKILISQQYTTKPDGIGLRNYWAPAILDSLKLMAHNYKKWKKKYGK